VSPALTEGRRNAASRHSHPAARCRTAHARQDVRLDAPFVPFPAICDAPASGKSPDAFSMQNVRRCRPVFRPPRDTRAGGGRAASRRGESGVDPARGARRIRRNCPSAARAAGR
jgi:hypothetical protein